VNEIDEQCSPEWLVNRIGTKGFLGLNEQSSPEWLAIVVTCDACGKEVEVLNFKEKPDIREFEDTQGFRTIKLFKRIGNKWVCQ